MKLENIKANFLGDSITAGSGVTSKDKLFHALLKEKFNFGIVRNYGIGGTRIARQKFVNPLKDFGDCFCDRLGQMDNDADLIVVFGGTNDYGHGNAPLGTSADRDPTTFYGACHYLYRGLMEKYPCATIVVMTPFHRKNEHITSLNEADQPLSVFVDIIKQVASEYSLPVLDLWSTSGIQPNIDIIAKKYCPDGLHPNDEGHQRLAERLGNFLLTL